MNTFSDIIEEADKLTLEEQETLIGILQKRIAEEKRKRLEEEILISKEEHGNGDYSQGNSSGLFKALNI